MLDPANVWLDEFENLPAVLDTSWATNLADLIDNLTTNKLEITGITPSATFTFAKPVFEAALLPIVAGPPPVPQQQIAAAWQTAMTASTMLIASGASIGAPSPATTFSAPPLTLIEPASVTAAATALQVALLAAVPVEDPQDSTVPLAFRTAFISCLATATGLNSISPPAGPTPLLLPPTPLL